MPYICVPYPIDLNSHILRLVKGQHDRPDSKALECDATALEPLAFDGAMLPEHVECPKHAYPGADHAYVLCVAQY
jgi:hypothetical protein